MFKKIQIIYQLSKNCLQSYYFKGFAIDQMFKYISFIIVIVLLKFLLRDCIVCITCIW